jgi:hypothetical protein
MVVELTQVSHDLEVEEPNKQVHHWSRKLRPPLGQETRARLLLAESGTIRPIRPHRGEGVADTENLRLYADLIIPKALGIARAVDSLVMLTDDLRNVAHAGSGRYEKLPLGRVVTDEPPIFGG